LWDILTMEEEYIKGERVAVFIDGNNLYHCLKDKGWRIRTDIGLLARRLVGSNRLLQHIYYYNAPPPGNKPHTEKSNAYLARVKKTPNLTFRASWLQPIQKADQYGIYSSYREKGGDTALTTDMVSGAVRDEFDTAIIVASDGDYAPAAEMLTSYKKSVEVIYFPGRRPFAMEKYTRVMRAFRPGYAVPYDAELPPSKETYNEDIEKTPKFIKPKKDDWRKDDYLEDEE
jgi:uncharacterized LabA/DUF88 family protein